MEVDDYEEAEHALLLRLVMLPSAAWLPPGKTMQGFGPAFYKPMASRTLSKFAARSVAA